jgi:hypothetical protein
VWICSSFPNDIRGRTSLALLRLVCGGGGGKWGCFHEFATQTHHFYGAFLSHFKVSLCIWVAP